MAEVIRTTGILLAGALLAACGPSVGDSGDGPAPGSTGGPVDSSGTAGAEGTGAVDGSTEAPVGSSSGEAASTGEPGPELWTPASHTNTWIDCDGDEAFLFVEATVPRFEVQQCIPPPDVDVDDVVLVQIQPWDGQAGTFVLGDGASASVGTPSPDPPQGEIVLEVSEPWMPTLLTFVINEEKGSLDLTECLSIDAPLPCA